MPVEEKSKSPIILLLLALVGAPFLATLVKFFKKGPNEPVTMQDLLTVFGVQVFITVLLIIYLVFFNKAVAVLG